MKIWRVFPLLLFAIVCLVGVKPAAADGIIIIDPPPDIPPIRLDEALTIKYHRVTVTIEDQVATTRVDQVFVNENPWMAEGTYVFPLPEGAAISEFVMWVDGVAVTGEILEAQEARQIYNDIVRRIQDPALLEYVGRDMVKASIFPLPAGEERRIELEYSQVLPVDNGLVHYVYPLSTEKYSARPLEEATVRVEIASRDALKAVYSPSHEVFIERDGDYQALVGWEAYDLRPDTDFELYYTVSPEDVGVNLLSYQEAGQDGFFLLLAAPNVEVDPEAVIAKDVIFVLDVSGSMEGEKLEQAKQAVLYTLEHLNPQDRFGVVAFSTGLRTFNAQLTSAADWQAGAEFVERLEALGGTDINRALLEALDLADSERPTTLIFLTDGLATEGVFETPVILNNVDSAANSNVQLFSFGVGNDVDTDLLDALALDHGGTSAYVRPNQRIDEEVSAFYAKVSTPVLADIEIDFGGIQVEQLYPQDPPDLFAGSQLVLVGRYRQGGPATITLSGVVNGERVSLAYPDHYFRTTSGDDFIPRLWATRAIGYYLTQIRLHGENSEWVETIVDLSIRYGIITPYTSFLIDEDDIFTQTGRNQIAEEAEEAWAEPAPSSGADAVEQAAGEGVLREAEIAPPMPTSIPMPGAAGGDEPVEVAELVKYVGSKTFVFRDGTWLDTAYDPAAMETVQVGFLSDNYFELTAAVPELGDYFAIGQRVIVVHDNLVYEVVEGPGDEVPIPEGGDSTSQPVTELPTPIPADPNDPATPVPPTRTPDPVAVPLAPEPAAPQPAEPNAAGPGETETDTKTTGLCAAAFIAPGLMLGLAAVFVISHSKQQD